MRKLYSYKLESHTGVSLIQHLKFVGDRCYKLINNKNINFKYDKKTIKYIAKVMGYCHDLGKGTKYFQEYLKNSEEYLNNNSSDLKSHAHLSAVFAYFNLKDYDKNLAIIIYISVVSHHGRLKNFKDYMYIEKLERKKLFKQYGALDEEIKIICKELNLHYLSKEKFKDTIDEIEEEIDEYNDNLDENNDFELYILVRYLFSILIYAYMQTKNMPYLEKKTILSMICR